MNFSDIQHSFTLVCAAGGLACVAALVLYPAWHIMLELLDRFCAASPMTKLVVLVAAVGATLFAGAKHGGSTNEPPLPPPTMLAMPQPPSTSQTPQIFQTVPFWGDHGAWGLWTRIRFSNGFAFPYGTNLVEGVTLMSDGALRLTLQDATPLVSLPQPVSVEPGASSVSCGLTASNTFVFVWEDVCVNREATNRVNAAIELFPDGSIGTRFGDLVGRVAPRPPEGFVGEGQDAAWVANALPEFAEAIGEKGYDTWLEEDYVGVNVENGRYQLKVTVRTLPEDIPCYLMCGPYKMVLRQPGTYSFPLEVFETYKIRTYPVALPLTFESDDGYRDGDETPGLRMSAPPMLTSPAPPDVPDEYERTEQPRFVLKPCQVALSQAVGTIITIWCNVANGFQTRFRSLTGGTQLRFTAPSQAEIIDARVADLVAIFKELDDKSCGTVVDIYDDMIHEHHGDLTCCCGSTHCPNCTCCGCLYDGVCYCGHVLTDEELERLWGDAEP